MDGLVNLELMKNAVDSPLIFCGNCGQSSRARSSVNGHRKLPTGGHGKCPPAVR